MTETGEPGGPTDLDRVVAAMKDRFDGIDQRFDGIDQRFDRWMGGWSTTTRCWTGY